MSELRRAVGGVLLGVGTVAVSGVLVLGFAVVSWSARSGFLPPLRALMLTSVLALSVGLVLWGRDRWRSVFGAIGITVGLVGASVAATVPVATRSAEWVARGGPAPCLLYTSPSPRDRG